MTDVIARIREKLAYDPETGAFTWRICWQGRKKKVGHINSDGYLKIEVSGREYSAQRLAWLLTRGAWPEGEIDHMNCDRLDNRLANLRDVSHRTNSHNQNAARGWQPKKGRFQAVLGVDGINKYLGTFDTAEEARAAYVAAKRIHHEGFLA